MGSAVETPGLADLPQTLPIFPLTGVLLLPRGRLPLNIFEPRYLNMTRDALAGDRLIGMIQPSGEESGTAAVPAVYGVGCAGRITECRETDDGRLLITLTGIVRFAVGEELATTRGYRRIVPDWQRFADDLAAPQPVPVDRARLLNGLQAFFKLHGITADWSSIHATPDERLVTSLAMICPFAPNEKQALLEAADLGDRCRIMTALIEMAVLQHQAPSGDAARH